MLFNTEISQSIPNLKSKNKDINNKHYVVLYKNE